MVLVWSWFDLGSGLGLAMMMTKNHVTCKTLLVLAVKKFCVLQKKVKSCGLNLTVDVRPNRSVELNVRLVPRKQVLCSWLYLT